MPAQQGKDSKSCFWRWGGSGKKYYYKCGSKPASAAAKKKAVKQGAAIFSTGWKGNMKEKIKAHLFKPQGITKVIRNVVEEWQDPMAEITEDSIDPDNRIVKGVCIFGKRESENGYSYSDKAISTLANMVEGVKVFINHPSRSEAKDRDGVRDLRDWVGIYTSPRQDRDKVYADLSVRESYWDLVRDIALMQPAKVGNSINARVKIYIDDTGKESVVDLDKLHSVDLVASGATIENLWESAGDKAEEEENEVMEQVLGVLEESFSNLIEDIKEGILADKIKQDEIRSKANSLLWKADGMIYSILQDKDDEIKTFKEKRKRISSILDDLERELNKIMPKIKPGEEKLVVKFPTIVLPDQI